MKIESKAAPKLFEAIQVTLVVETREELKALEFLCESRFRHFTVGSSLYKILEDLAPHVTAL